MSRIHGPDICALVACLLLTLPYSVSGQDLTQQQRILALYVTTPGAAGATAFETVYQKTFADALGSRLDFHSEYIDLPRFSEPGYPEALVEFFAYKYRRLPPDVVIATTEGARQFFERFRAELFPGVPLVFIDRTKSPQGGPGMTGVSATLDLTGTLDLALALQPETTHVFVIGGVSEFDHIYERLAREQLPRFEGRVSLTYMFGTPLKELEQTVAHLPPKSIIYFMTLGDDGSGGRFRSTDVIDYLSAVANVPMYGWNGTAMTHGIVGGRLYTNEVVAERSAELTLRVLRGEKPEAIPVVTVDPIVSQLDWRQLQRWRISAADAPEGTAIMFREPTLWERYNTYIASAVALILFQAALIARLLVQRARGRRMEAALREHQTTLGDRNIQITDLFGRLIAAQEAERTRIARDLHDDVSQRIAGLSIMLSRMKRQLTRPSNQGEISTTMGALQEHTIALADDIRHLSHDLHPGPLQHSGLVTALKLFCAEFEKMHPIAVTYTAGDIGHIEADAALGLYRIAQEALRNVVKHAKASQVSVALTRTTDAVQLSITDDGQGFDLAGKQGKGAGLGLVSIDERARLLRGSVHIDTHARGGTQVRVQIPQAHEIAAPTEAVTLA